MLSVDSKRERVSPCTSLLRKGNCPVGTTRLVLYGILWNSSEIFAKVCM